MEALEKLEVWQRSCRLAISIYEALNPSNEFAFKDQITRSALSVASNIAEGYERSSPKQFAQYLRIAKGSCGELRTQLYIGKEAGFIAPSDADPLIAEAIEISKMVYGLIKYCETKSS